MRPDLDGVQLRQAFFEDELDHQSLASRLRVYVHVGSRAGGVITPVKRDARVEGTIYGAIYLDFANRVGLREAVGLVLDSQAASFNEFHTYVGGRGNPVWLAALVRTVVDPTATSTTVTFQPLSSFAPNRYDQPY